MHEILYTLIQITLSTLLVMSLITCVLFDDEFVRTVAFCLVVIFADLLWLNVIVQEMHVATLSP